MGINVYKPEEISSLTLEMIEYNINITRVYTGIGSLDTSMRAMRGGELIVFIGRPSNFKSGLMQFIARNEATNLMNHDITDHAVFYVTWEQSVEDMALLELAAMSGQDSQDLAEGKIESRDALNLAAASRAGLPLWAIGHSLKRRSRRPRLTMSNVVNALYFCADEWGIQPQLIVLDYLQRIMPEGGSDLRMINSINVDKAKDLALEMGCPVLLGCQAKREVDSRRNQIPQLGDGAESSAIEHTADRILGLHMPYRSMMAGESLLENYNIDILCRPDLVLAQLVKHKTGQAGGLYPLIVEPGINGVRSWS